MYHILCTSMICLFERIRSFLLCAGQPWTAIGYPILDKNRILQSQSEEALLLFRVFDVLP